MQALLLEHKIILNMPDHSSCVIFTKRIILIESPVIKHTNVDMMLSGNVRAKFVNEAVNGELLFCQNKIRQLCW